MAQVELIGRDDLLKALNTELEDITAMSNWAYRHALLRAVELVKKAETLNRIGTIEKRQHDSANEFDAYLQELKRRQEARLERRRQLHGDASATAK